jgi:hypothetical protein
MKWRLLLSGCGLACLASAASAQQPATPDVALAPFAVVADQKGDLRRVADDCLEQLATALAAKGVKVARLQKLDEKTMATARPARWAVLGKFERLKDTISAELRLMEVATGDEMRSYFHTSADPKDIAALGARAADRIALFVKEQRSAR